MIHTILITTFPSKKKTAGDARTGGLLQVPSRSGAAPLSAIPQPMITGASVLAYSLTLSTGSSRAIFIPLSRTDSQPRLGSVALPAELLLPFTAFALFHFSMCRIFHYHHPDRNMSRACSKVSSRISRIL